MAGVIPAGAVTWGMQLPIQSQSTAFVQPWETTSGPAELASIAVAADRAGAFYVAVCDHIAIPRPLDELCAEILCGPASGAHARAAYDLGTARGVADYLRAYVGSGADLSDLTATMPIRPPGGPLAPLVREGQVRITEGALAVTVDINASVLFAPGDARLDFGAVQALTAVARILAPTDFPVTVEGHTDNTPIATPMFPSNWELSGMRASAVVRLFIDQGVDPRRLTATGYADQRPVDDNASPEGRSRNRRVAITIESKAPDSPIEIKIP